MTCRRQLILLAATSALTFLSLHIQGAVTGTIDMQAPPAPAGFESRQAVMAAILKQELKLIETEFPTPSGIKETKNIEYGRVGDRAL